MEPLRILRLNRTTLRVWDSFNRDSMGKHILRYEFKVGRVLIFEGADFHCPPSICVDSLKAAYSILSFLCLRPGDVEKEYFSDYNMEQLAWANSTDCEYLQCIVCDWEEKNRRN